MAYRIRILWKKDSKFLQTLDGEFFVENESKDKILNGKIRKEKFRCSINNIRQEDGSLDLFYKIKDTLMIMIDSFYKGYLLEFKDEKWVEVDNNGKLVRL